MVPYGRNPRTAPSRRGGGLERDATRKGVGMTETEIAIRAEDVRERYRRPRRGTPRAHFPPGTTKPSGAAFHLRFSTVTNRLPRIGLCSSSGPKTHGVAAIG